jgi:hypothetical protein
MQMAQANPAPAARVPELEASSATRESHESTSESATNSIPGSQEVRGKRRRGWWARVFLRPEEGEA